MKSKKQVLIIIGSASEHSANEALMHHFATLTTADFQTSFLPGLKTLPHFDPELSANNPPATIIKMRKAVESADGVIICTPEYIFSIPSGLKNLLEWCVATTIFQNKPLGLITASANGQQGHEELQRIMKTLMAKFTSETTLLIQGVRGKVGIADNNIDVQTDQKLQQFTTAFKALVAGNTITEII